MKKFKVLMLITLMSSLILFGCGNKSKDLEKVVENFFESMKKSDFEKLDELILDDKETLIYSNIDEDIYMDLYLDYFKENIKMLDYNIVETDTSGSQPTVLVDLKYVDGESVIEETIGEVKKLDLSKDGVEKEVRSILDGARDKKENLKSLSMEVKLVKENGQWYIDDFDNDFFDIYTSNIRFALGETGGIGDLKGGNSKKRENFSIEEFKLGEKIEGPNFSIKANTIEEAEEVFIEGVEKKARAGHKYIVLELEFVNEDNLKLKDTVLLVDNKGKEYHVEDYFVDTIESNMSSEKLGMIIFEVDENIEGYSLLIEDRPGEKLYEVILR